MCGCGDSLRLAARWATILPVLGLVVGSVLPCCPLLAAATGSVPLDRGSVSVSAEGDLLLLPPAGGTVLINDTDVLFLFKIIQELQVELASLKEVTQSLNSTVTLLGTENRQLNSTIASLEAENRQLNVTLASLATREGELAGGALPSDITAFTNGVLKVTGAGRAEVDGYYTQIPGACNGKVCYSKILGPDVRISWRDVYRDGSGTHGTGTGWIFYTSFWNGIQFMLYDDSYGTGKSTDYGTVIQVLYSSAATTSTPPTSGWSAASGAGPAPSITFL